jgi:hypothetical protein
MSQPNPTIRTANILRISDQALRISTSAAQGGNKWISPDTKRAISAGRIGRKLSLGGWIGTEATE